MGLAAIIVAHHLGAQVFVIAVSERERAHLRGLGVVHVFDAQSL
jgi:NADPH:quinone reductase-like Zn-dependent oxidoreductase